MSVSVQITCNWCGTRIRVQERRRLEEWIDDNLLPSTTELDQLFRRIAGRQYCSPSCEKKYWAYKKEN